jgi:hypothetical protein
MTFTTLLTPNFQIQFDPAIYPGPGELSAVQNRAAALETSCEPDYAVLCEWSGVAVGEGLGPRNRVIVTLVKDVRGGTNTGYSANHPQMRVEQVLSDSDDHVRGVFVAEMIEILMSFTGSWNRVNSGGEGLSRVAAQLLHPQYGNGFVNAWLASDPTTDTSSAVADSEFRKDWVSQNFTGGPLRAGGPVRGDDDSYSYGCAMLFIYYLKSQLGFSMPQIVQNGGPTLADTYRALTNGQTNGFWAFKSLLDEHFPIGVQSPTDDPFPLPAISIPTRVAPGAGSSGNTTALAVTGTDDRIFYTWWDLGQSGQGYGELDGGGRSDAAPAAALVGPQHNYLFVAIKGPDDYLLLNQGELGKPFAGWGSMDFQTGGAFQSAVAPGLASSGNTSAVVAASTDGRIFYDWWDLGQSGHGFTELDGGGHTDAAPAAALVGPQHNYLFVAIKGPDDYLLLNQGELGKPFAGWQ